MPLDGLKELIDNLTAFDFGQEMETIVGEHTEDITELLKVQLAAGKDGNGEPVTLDGNPDYAPFTIEIKEKYGQGLGKVTDRITTYMTGDLYRSLKTKAEGRVFETDANVPYFDDVIDRTGDQIMDLDEDSRLKFAEEITLPAIADVLYAKTELEITSK
jgi:hypothetical protein